MEDMSRKINELLSDPQMMEQIKGLAGMLGQSQKQPEPEPQNNILQNMPDPNMIGTVMKLAPFLQSAGGEDDGTRLLRAAAHQAPRPLGFSRQEHWSGLPFPSPMHEREK